MKIEETAEELREIANKAGKEYMKSCKNFTHDALIECIWKGRLAEASYFHKEMEKECILVRIEENKSYYGLTINEFDNKQFDKGWKEHEKEINIQIKARIAQLKQELEEME